MYSPGSYPKLRPVPALGARTYADGMDEKELLIRYLGAARTALLWKLDGLSEADARRPRTPTGTNLAGLVKHCAFIEAGYFGVVFGRDASLGHDWGDADARDGGPNADLALTAEERLADIIDLYRRLGDYVTATIHELPLDTPGVVPWWGERSAVTLRQVAVHVLGDIARHAGHADILREQLDGAAGLRPDNDNLGVPSAGWAAHVRRLGELADAYADDDTDIYADE